MVRDKDANKKQHFFSFMSSSIEMMLQKYSSTYYTVQKYRRKKNVRNQITYFMQKFYTVALVQVLVCYVSTVSADKEGRCPPPRKDIYDIDESCKVFCLKDSVCPADLKCCNNGCGRECIRPYNDGPSSGLIPLPPSFTDKPGTCPLRVDVNPCARQCRGDYECSGDLKCCVTTCGLQCVRSSEFHHYSRTNLQRLGPPSSQNVQVGEKEGTCPHPSTLNMACIEQCSNDYRCEGKLKCCKNGCGHVCTLPDGNRFQQPSSAVEVKEGECPRPQLKGDCDTWCNSDLSCPGIEKCCFNGCAQSCMEPDPSPNSNGCPPSCPGECVDECLKDVDCGRGRYCLFNGCIRFCSPGFPVENYLPSDTSCEGAVCAPGSRCELVFLECPQPCTEASQYPECVRIGKGCYGYTCPEPKKNCGLEAVSECEESEDPCEPLLSCYSDEEMEKWMAGTGANSTAAVSLFGSSTGKYNQQMATLFFNLLLQFVWNTP